MKKVLLIMMKKLCQDTIQIHKFQLYIVEIIITYTVNFLKIEHYSLHLKNNVLKLKKRVI